MHIRIFPCFSVDSVAILSVITRLKMHEAGPFMGQPGSRMIPSACRRSGL